MKNNYLNITQSSNQAHEPRIDEVYALNPLMCMRNEQDFVGLYKFEGKVEPKIHHTTGIILALCNGKRTIGDIAKIVIPFLKEPSAHNAKEEALSWVKAVINDFSDTPPPEGQKNVIEYLANSSNTWLIPSSLFYYLIIGSGLSRLQKKYIVVAILCIMSLSFSSLKNYYANHLPGLFAEHVAVQTKKEHREAAGYLSENLQKEDVVFHTCRNTVPPFEYYFGNIYGGDASIEKDLVLRFSEDRDTLLSFEYSTEFQRFIDRSQDAGLDGNKRIWLIFSAWDYELSLGQGSEEAKVVQWMDEHYSKISSKVFSGITVYLYE